MADSLAYVIASLSEEEIQDIILEILTGERVVISSSVAEEILVFKYPSATSRQLYNLSEKLSVDKAVSYGLIREQQMPEELLDAFFTVEDMEELCDLEKKAEGTKLLLKKRIKGTDLYRKDSDRLVGIQFRIKSLEGKKSISKQFTAEYQAKEDTYFEILAESVFDIYGNRKWESLKDMLDLTDITYIYKLLHKFLDFYWGHSTEVLRKVARSGQWKSMYYSAEKGAKLTEKPAKDLSASYLRLMSWSQYYQNISEIPMAERPSNSIVEDDTKLDEYIGRYRDKVEAESLAAARSRQSKKGSLSVSDKDQVVVTPESRNYVSLHKSDEYSDTQVIGGRATEDGPSDTSYSEIRERRVKAQEKSRKKKARINKAMRGNR